MEGLIRQNAPKEQAGSLKDWQQVKDCWVLKPPARAGKPQAVAVFAGGAFVGSAPQIVYKLFLEALAARGILVRIDALHAPCLRHALHV